MKPTMLILAAGVGSRYGGLKQLDGVGPGGAALMDYTIYDALQIGAKVLEAIRQPFGLPGQVARVTASLGVSIFPEHGSDAGTGLGTS